jgi:hypothetical protein
MANWIRNRLAVIRNKADKQIVGFATCTMYHDLGRTFTPENDPGEYEYAPLPLMNDLMNSGFKLFDEMRPTCKALDWSSIPQDDIIRKYWDNRHERERKEQLRLVKREVRELSRSLRDLERKAKEL